MELIGALGPVVVWTLAVYRASCFVGHREPHPRWTWPLSLLALLWLGLLSRTIPKVYVVPVLLERLTVGLIVSGYPPPAPPVEPAPALAPVPLPGL